MERDFGWIGGDLETHVCAPGIVMHFRVLTNRQSAEMTSITQKAVRLARDGKSLREDDPEISEAARVALIGYVAKVAIDRIEGGPGGGTLKGEALRDALMDNLSEHHFNEIFAVITAAQKPTPAEGKEQSSESSPQG